MAKCVLAFSEGVDTLVAISWLKEHHNLDVIAITADLGQDEDFEALGESALRAGAVAARVEDLRESFYRDFISPSLRALAHYERHYLLAAALSRPLIARELARVANEEGAAYVAHGCSSRGNDQIRFETAVLALAPHLKIIAPLREIKYKSREQRIEYAKTKNLQLPNQPTEGSCIGHDLNLWGQSIECARLKDASHCLPEEAYTLTVSPIKAPNEPTEVVIEFQEGLPIGLNGKQVNPVSLIEELNKLAGAHGIGRTDIIEDRLIGFKSREVYEAPAASTLYVAKRGLEQLTLSRETLQVREGLATAYGRCVYNGQWFSDLREALDEFFKRINKPVTGKVTARLYKGQAFVMGRSSEFSLMSVGAAAQHELISGETAAGFIKVWSMPLSVEAQRKKK